MTNNFAVLNDNELSEVNGGVGFWAAVKAGLVLAGKAAVVTGSAATGVGIGIAVVGVSWYLLDKITK
jgi:bacteriocin-like protein